MNTSMHNKMLFFVLHHWGTCYNVYSNKHRPHHGSPHKLSLLTTTTPIQSQNAQQNLGICYENGDGITQDYQEARRLYALASAQGLAEATDGGGLTRISARSARSSASGSSSLARARRT